MPFQNNLKLQAHNIASTRGERVLFSNVNFTVRSGESLVVSGANGIGKSTLLRIIAGLLRPTHGRIMLESGDEPFLSMHYMGHKQALRDALTPRENLVFLGRLFGADYQPKIDTALSTLGIARVADLPVGVLSAGQKRRVGLAGLLISNRPIWVLDEPTSTLDSDAQALFAKLVASHCAQGGIVIAATHLPLGIAAQELRMA